MRIGIVGLKYTGKTTLFNAVTGGAEPTGQGGVEAHLAVGKVPDPRLDRLTGMFRPRKQVNATVEWVDVPGLEQGPGDRREATRFLEHARRVDALAQVARCFDGGYGAPDPVGEMEALALDLAVADLQVVENRLERLQAEKQKTGKVTQALEPDLMERCRRQLESERPLRELELGEDERRLVAGYSFLTLKPMIYVLNHAEDEPPAPEVAARAAGLGGEVVVLCARMEAELAELPPAERQEFLRELGIEEPASHRMIRAAYAALDLRSFFTYGEDECRAWTIVEGTRAPQAAGVIHSDMERGFIRAEVLAYDDLLRHGSVAAARQAGRVRLEGKEYVVQDGDLMTIRFSV